jgi:succinyl-CoA synthetase beta subunit
VNLLFYPEAEGLLKEANIPLVPGKLVTSEKEALEAVRQMGFPVALKLVSSGIIHKHQMGVVKLNIVNETQLKETYRELSEKAKILCDPKEKWGILVQKMITGTLEIALGAYRDKGFGPVLMLGLGGIFVEIFKETSFRLLPLGLEDIKEMMEETKLHQLLKTHTKSPSVMENLINIILNFSNLFLSKPEIQEIDLNPILITTSDCFVVDAKIFTSSD